MPSQNFIANNIVAILFVCANKVNCLNSKIHENARLLKSRPVEHNESETMRATLL